MEAQINLQLQDYFSPTEGYIPTQEGRLSPPPPRFWVGHRVHAGVNVLPHLRLMQGGKDGPW